MVGVGVRAGGAVEVAVTMMGVFVGVNVFVRVKVFVMVLVFVGVRVGVDV